MHSTTTPLLDRAAYSVKQTAEILSIGRTSLYAQIKTGKLRATKLGRKTIFLAKDINAFLDRLQQEGVTR